MPRPRWLVLVVCVALVAPVSALEPPSMLPAFPVPPAAPASPPAAGGTAFASPPSGGQPSGGAEVHGGESLLRDLTPPGFADLHPPPDPHAHGDHGTPGHLTPTVPGHAGFYGTAEYLLFRPRSGSLDYALQNGTTGLATAGAVRSQKYDLGNGLRVESGYRAESGWDAAFAFTFLGADGERNVAAGPNQVVFPTLTRPGLTDTAVTAAGNVKLDYYLYDMVIGKRFALDDHLAVRGFAGFRFADFTQRLNAFYDGFDAVQSVVNTRSRFQGFGPLVGGEAILGGWRGFHGYARASGGLLTGRSNYQIRETNNAGGTVLVDSSYGYRKVVPVAGIAIGAGWQYRSISLRAGYEVTHWFGLTEPVRFVDDVGQGKIVSRPSNFSLEGLFVQVGLTFSTHPGLAVRRLARCIPAGSVVY